jgi:hypothetical protein
MALRRSLRCFTCTGSGFSLKRAFHCWERGERGVHDARRTRKDQVYRFCDPLSVGQIVAQPRRSVKGDMFRTRTVFGQQVTEANRRAADYCELLSSADRCHVRLRCIMPHCNCAELCALQLCCITHRCKELPSTPSKPRCQCQCVHMVPLICSAAITQLNTRLPTRTPHVSGPVRRHSSSQESTLGPPHPHGPCRPGLVRVGTGRADAEPEGPGPGPSPLSPSFLAGRIRRREPPPLTHPLHRDDPIPSIPQSTRVPPSPHILALLKTQ